MGDWDYINENMGGFDDDGLPNFLSHNYEEDDQEKDYNNYSSTVKNKQLETIEINLTPSNYLNSEERYLRAKLINNELKSSDINLEVMHDRYNNNDSLALEVYCNHVMIGHVQKYNSLVNIDDFCFINNEKIKNLTLKWENSKFYLSKIEKREIQPTVLNKVSTQNLDTGWMTALFSWADANDIYTSAFPRTKEIMHLTSLDLHHNKLTELPKEIGNLTNLTDLCLIDNQLTELPKEIGNLTNLRSLTLGRNKLTELPKEIGNLTNLETLYLDSNQLTELPKELYNLTNLGSLTLGRNQLTELPKEIGNLTDLVLLTFDHNQITKLPKEIGNLTNLDNLEFDENQLTELPKEIGNLTDLVLLIFRHNQITELPKEIGNLTNLRQLEFDENQITELPKEMGNLTDLTCLVLDHDKITELSEEQYNLIWG